ncbi:YdcF family protein [Bacillus haikouensis]|uniref:YdcF family protein n=1 Tax=Bacillus haikouensis TaxID=1510468 RepID=UPI0015570FD9|nr:YdcF family protein [Bacillus haikouensis]NQD64394.1 YdcF family protein [Bacillus haikouensis]
MKNLQPIYIFPILIIGLLLVLFGRTFGVLFIAANLVFILMIVILQKKYRATLKKPLSYTARFLMAVYGLFLLSFIAVEGFIFYELEKSKDVDVEEIDAVIILGAGLKGDIPSKTLLSRLEAGKTVLLENKDLPVVVSGGQGEGESIPEAEAMGIYLMEHGISEDRIIYEKTSTTTFENLLNSKKILNQKGFKDPNILIVTSDYHVVRAMMLADELGLDSEGLGGGSPFIVRVNYFIREYFAIMKTVGERIL